MTLRALTFVLLVLSGCATTTMELRPNTPGIYELKTGTQVSETAFIQTLRGADVVLVGESHDSAADHAFQLKTYKSLSEKQKWTLGMEMFQRPFQASLDSYIAGETPEAQMLEEARYEERWGFEVEWYAPLWRRALEIQSPLVALNVRTELTKRVSAVGLQGLSKWETQDLPDIYEGPPEYAAWLKNIFSSHGMTLDDAKFRRFFQAQLLWDETMADTVSKRVKSGEKVFVIVGRGHVERDWGIPSRLQRRAPQTKIVTVVSATPYDSIERMKAEEIADYVVIH